MQFKTIKEINDGLVSKKFSVEELINDTFDLINQYKVLNCFISLNEETALARAKEIKVTEDSHLLSGIPIAQKDLFCTKGIKTTCGSKMLQSFYPPYSSKVEEALNAAGSICIGKTNMDEFAMGSSNETSFFGNVHNPWKKGFVPGGSSGGAACSVAAGLVPAATGTDTGGSIRQPAALCGLTGIKPTYGRISRWGMIAFASSLDQAGPICRTAEDCSILLDAMSGYDSRDTTSLNLDPTNTFADLSKSYENLRIGIVDEFNIDALSKESQMLFDESTSEKIKKTVGCATDDSEKTEMTVTGRNLAEGIPESFTLNSQQVFEAMKDPLFGMVRAIRNALELSPPELAADIAERGIVLTGGGAMLRDLDKLISNSTGIPVIIAEDPLTCVARGGGQALEIIDKYNIDLLSTE